MEKENIYPIIQAVLAAALFGASAPVAKLFLNEVEPIPMASFLYLGSGAGLLLLRGIFRLGTGYSNAETKITKSDFKWLLGALLAGGVAAPIVLMFSLRGTPAATASLLLNFEVAATTLIAALFFREAIGKRIWLAVAAITISSVLLSWNAGGEWGISTAAVGVLGACVLWGMDNNFTRNISAKDPLAIAIIKGIGAGSFSLVLALLLHDSFPDFKIMFGAMLLGFFSYGLSIVLFILAMRNFGAARAGAFFGTAPFAGVLLSFLLFREVPDMLFFVSLLIMVTGAALLLGEKHSHMHFHLMEHEHRHSHNDRHHMHRHAEGEPPEHSHLHKHEVSESSHPHTPDIHHRHEH